jgi:hypothetical protein
MSFDWKDGLLVSAGFLAGVALLFLLKTTLGIDADDGLVELVGLLSIGGPLAGRRAIFGAPELPEPRRGVLPSLMSIAGLLATLFGLLALVAGARNLSSGFHAAPDFEREARAGLQAGHDVLEGALRDVPGVSTDEGRAEFEATVQELATRDREEWASTQGALRERGWGLLGGGALLVALGTLATWARYRPVAA